MTRQFSSRRALLGFYLAVAALIATAAAILAPIPAEGIEPDAAASRQFWGTFAVSALDIEPADSLESVMANSDAMVVGQIIRVDPGRIVGDPVEGIPTAQVLFANVTIAVAEVLRGELPLQDRATLTLEVLLPGRTDFGELSTLNARIPSEPSIFFLRNNASTAAAMGLPPEVQERERPYYHLTIQRAVLASEAGIVAAPIWTDHVDFFVQLEGQTFDALVGDLRQP